MAPMTIVGGYAGVQIIMIFMMIMICLSAMGAKFGAGFRSVLTQFIFLTYLIPTNTPAILYPVSHPEQISVNTR